jgi:hypothetical protein
MIISQATVVESSTIDSLLYLNNKTLLVSFKHGVTYSYFEVTMEDYLALISSESIGKALNQIIKGKYEFKKHEEQL